MRKATHLASGKATGQTQTCLSLKPIAFNCIILPPKGKNEREMGKQIEQQRDRKRKEHLK